MADRLTPSPRGDSGERRSTTSRPTGGYSERPQTSRPTGGYSERPQTSRPAGGYSERPQTSRPAGGYSERPQASRPAGGPGERPQASRAGGSGERRTASPRSGGSASRQSTPRRADVIRCENCGEDYSTTYKRCPFCDERPGRGGISGKRVANTRGGGYGRPVNPIQVAGLVISLVLIASALFIVFRFVGAPVFGKNNKPSGSTSQDTSQGAGQNNASGSSANNPGSTAPPMVQSIALNNADAPLENGGTCQMTANLLPAGATGDVSWSSSDPAVATVDANGLVTNVNSGSSDVRVTITATCSGVTAETAVTCKAKGATGPASSGTKGRIVNAQKGLNIRSGPGTNYEKVASAQNGAQVIILGEENGFYKISYAGNKTGYVSKDYVRVG